MDRCFAQNSLRMLRIFSGNCIVLLSTVLTNSNIPRKRSRFCCADASAMHRDNVTLMQRRLSPPFRHRPVYGTGDGGVGMPVFRAWRVLVRALP